MRRTGTRLPSARMRDVLIRPDFSLAQFVANGGRGFVPDRQVGRKGIMMGSFERPESLSKERLLKMTLPSLSTRTIA